MTIKELMEFAKHGIEMEIVRTCSAITGGLSIPYSVEKLRKLLRQYDEILHEYKVVRCGKTLSDEELLQAIADQRKMKEGKP